jgi:ribonuclease HII
LRDAGYDRVAGIDEAGRGAWAGPVCAAAVILPLDRKNLTKALAGVRDSKMLSANRRSALRSVVANAALSVGVGWSLSAEVDAVGVAAATRRAMLRAIGCLAEKPDALLIDYVRLPDSALHQRSLASADAQCLSVAAASIVAKVERDRLMAQMDSVYRGYGFAAHKGYGTRRHAHALAALGPCPIHRMTWRPLMGAPE